MLVPVPEPARSVLIVRGSINREVKAKIKFSHQFAWLMLEPRRLSLRRFSGIQILRMTKRYTHATDQRKRQALERLALYDKESEKPAASQPICHNIVTMKA
jgi:hypothetical protein